MKKIKLLIVAMLLVFVTSVIQFANAEVYVGNIEDECVYTLSDTIYDEETGKLAYQKVSYNKNTYKTTNCTDLDASGGSVDVSNDAQYLFIPAKYIDFTESTLFSMKYRNNGVKKIALHAEYAAGISQGGVDYKAGYKFVCVNALSTAESWNVSNSKSVDGYDVLSVQFGSYANEIYDCHLVGFRLYFDYGLQVDSYREFEIFGYEVHETGIIPTFASDPKPTRVAKITSPDVEIKDNSFVVNQTATINAKILDYTIDSDQLVLGVNLSDKAKITVKLDNEVVSTAEYGFGDHFINLSLDKETYSDLQMVFEGTNTVVKLKSFEFLAKPYIDSFSGSNFTITENNGVSVVSYDFKTGWNKISAPIRKYNPDYDFLRIEFNLNLPVVMGIMIDDTYIRNHWSYTDPLAAGSYSFLYDISKLAISNSSSINIYLDPAVTGYAGVEGTKEVTFTNVQLISSEDMPKATITVDEKFEFTYDGKGKEATGATSNSGGKITYEYKTEDSSDEYYDSALPVDAGVYDVRVISPLTEEYGKTYAYSKLIINKASVSKPEASALKVDYENSKVYFDGAVYAVATDEEFNNPILSGGYVSCGMTLYFKYIESNNFYASDASSIVLDDQEAKFEVAINYKKEMTNITIPDSVEYSINGLNWTTGSDKRIGLEPGKIYLFRTKATDNSFASEITYIAVNPRVMLEENLVLESTTKNSITLQKIEGAEYKLSDTVWQDSNVFEGLKEGSKVIVYMRMKGTDTAYASEEVILEVTVGTMPDENPEPTPNPSNPSVTPEEPKGCGGSFVGSFFALIALGGVVFYVRNKKEEVM